MRIEHLHLKNFRSHENTKIALDDFNFCVGGNATGKTSLASAVAFLLTGKCQFTSEGGAGADEMIRLGAPEFYVAAQIGNTLIERTKSPKNHALDIGGHSGPLAAMQEKIYEALGVSGEVLSACLNSSRFLSMDEKGQKQLLAQILASDERPIPENVLADMKSIGFAVGVPKLTVSYIDSAYKALYDLRTETNRDVKALGPLKEPEIPADAPDFQTTRKKLDELRTELTLATAQKAREEERYRNAVNSAADQRKSLSEYKRSASDRMLSDDDIARYEAVLESREKADALAGKIAGFKQSIGSAESEARNDLATRRATVEEKRRNIRDQIRQKEEQIEILTRIRAADCPTCQRALSAKDKAALGSRLDDELAVLKKSLKDTDAEMPGLNIPEPDALTKLRKTLAKLETELADLGNIAEADAKMRAHRDAMVGLDRYERELKAITDPVAPDTAALGANIEELKSRIANGEQVLEQVRAIEHEREAFAKWKSKKAAFEKRLETIARLLDYFGPNGVKSEMVGDKIAPFQAAMNDVLGSFGYRVSFSLEPYNFYVTDAHDSKHARTLRQLSESEAWRFGVAFQIALAMATGLKFIIVDRADILDAHSRQVLAGLIVNSQLDQALILSTSDQAPPDELPEGVKFIVLGEQAVAA